ncbi:MAG: peptidoglycan-binding protein [Clostridia bacterium]|nr:peptidoglycan-binding protein [Clostridia bacterium]
MAYYNLEEQRNAILEIQRILRALDYLDSDLARTRLTGNYDTETRDAVRAFQKKYDLPVTGVVDHTTWQVLQAVDKAQKEATQLARAIYILPKNEDYTIYPGLKDNVIYVIQHLLNTISQEYDEINDIPFNGVYDSATENGIKEFQRINLIEPSGVIDTITFNRLAGEYERINSINQ